MVDHLSSYLLPPNVVETNNFIQMNSIWESVRYIPVAFIVDFWTKQAKLVPISILHVVIHSRGTVKAYDGAAHNGLFSLY
jgi:hypothetical protein